MSFHFFKIFLTFRQFKMSVSDSILFNCSRKLDNFYITIYTSDHLKLAVTNSKVLQSSSLI